MELLSTECMMKAQETQRKCEKSILHLCSSYLQEIKEKFEDDIEEDDNENSDDNLPSPFLFVCFYYFYYFYIIYFKYKNFIVNIINKSNNK